MPYLCISRFATKESEQPCFTAESVADDGGIDSPHWRGVGRECVYPPLSEWELESGALGELLTHGDFIAPAMDSFFFYSLIVL